ncbi:hypothetical protein Tco_1359063 [Tanacetum coccineum]
MHFVENRIGHTFDLNVCDLHRMLEMCLCDVDRMAVGMWFDCMAVMCIGYNLGKCCHIVGVGRRMMVVHFLEILDHFMCMSESRLHDYIARLKLGIDND